MTPRRAWMLVAALMLGLPGCVVHEREVVRAPAPPCAGGEWIQGHYGPQGAWHPAHWRCPGVVEEKIVVRP